MKKSWLLVFFLVLSCALAAGLFTACSEGGSQVDKAGACGGVAGVECPEGQFCELPEGKCGAADLEGTCIVQPEMCTRDYRPVCGCDGITYGNDCDRMSTGVQKDHDGECKDQ